MLNLKATESCPSKSVDSLMGLPFAEEYRLDFTQIEKYDKFVAIKVVDGVMVDYKKSIFTKEPIVFTVESVVADGLKLFQVGSYDSPVSFRKQGDTLSSFRSHNWVNWDKYIIIQVENPNV